jgi:hypothetical protein
MTRDCSFFFRSAKISVPDALPTVVFAVSAFAGELFGVSNSPSGRWPFRAKSDIDCTRGIEDLVWLSSGLRRTYGIGGGRLLSMYSSVSESESTVCVGSLSWLAESMIFKKCEHSFSSVTVNQKSVFTDQELASGPPSLNYGPSVTTDRSGRRWARVTAGPGPGPAASAGYLNRGFDGGGACARALAAGNSPDSELPSPKFKFGTVT